MDNYILRRAVEKTDPEKLNTLFTKVFYPEKVGELAENLFRYFPGMKPEYWFVAEHRESAKIVSAFCLIPWEWCMEKHVLKVAEMAIVGTLEEHRGMGLIKQLNDEFNKVISGKKFDLSVIQGIPGFYHKLGYHYAVEMENHFDVQLSDIISESKHFRFFKANTEHFDYLLQQDEFYRKNNFLSANRTNEKWNYLLTDGRNTCYGSQFWIAENTINNSLFYFRLPNEGFGTGLYISEVSENITQEGLDAVVVFCKNMAEQKGLDYLRFNFSLHSGLLILLQKYKVSISTPYAWQINIPDKIRLLGKMKPIFEKRIESSVFHLFSGIFRIDLYTEKVDLIWDNGKLAEIKQGTTQEIEATVYIPQDMFASVLLGCANWRNYQRFRPDLNVYDQFERFKPPGFVVKIASMVDVLFPTEMSWIYMQY